MTGLLILICSTVTAEPAPTISPATIDEHGFRVHGVDSVFQKGLTQIRVLVPDNLRSDRKYPAIYVLPVEAQNEGRYGDGLLEVKQHDLHNTHQAFFVAPTFSHLPWYADHPTDPAIRQESYFLSVVVPYIDRTYPVQADAAGRLLLGFSKSGCGAWSMLLRHPDKFARAAAWDAPLMMDRLGKYGTSPIFGSQENFEKYRVTDLLEQQRESLQRSTRLVLLGYGNFRRDHEEMHARLEQWKIPHEYRDGPERKHDWHSGWVAPAVELLVHPRNSSNP